MVTNYDEWSAREHAERERRRRKQDSIHGPYSPDDTLIADFNISERAYHCLLNEGIKTAGEVRALSDNELRRYPNFGLVSLMEVRRVIGPTDDWRSDKAVRESIVRAVVQLEAQVKLLKHLVEGLK